MTEANTKYYSHDMQKAGFVGPAFCIPKTIIIPHKEENLMDKAVAFVLGFVTGAAALGTVACLAKNWASDEGKNKDTASPISATTNGTSDKGASPASSDDVSPAQNRESANASDEELNSPA